MDSTRSCYRVMCISTIGLAYLRILKAYENRQIFCSLYCRLALRCCCYTKCLQAHPESQNSSSSSSTSEVCLMTVAPGVVPVGRSSHASGQCVPEGYPTLTNTAAAFLAGLLEHLPGTFHCSLLSTCASQKFCMPWCDTSSSLQP